ncbi:OmpA family protein [candidate division KSB1 bacterium]|nr:OmpA family protein [candidate division KSB1 bacterium]
MTTIRTVSSFFLATICLCLFEGLRSAAPAQNNSLAEGWAKYDFIPGSSVLFFDDFSGDDAGRAPGAWKIIEGKAEVIQFENQRWLRAVNAAFAAPPVQQLPSQFTLEMDFYVIPRGYSGKYRIDIYGKTDDEWATFTIEDVAALNTSWGLSIEQPVELKGRHRLAIMADGSGFKCYIDSLRVVEAAKLGNFQPKDIEIYMPGGEEQGDDKCVITNVRLAASKSFREQIETQGKIISYGILFEKDAAALKPASMATLKALATLLQNDVGLELSIECHTYDSDDDGDNTRLSQRRAEALREILSIEYKIDRDRLRTKGLGASKPLKDRGTIEGLAANPRVEFVKR